ncbi:MAG: hypothetical protein U1F66_11090 [bacterium]
MIRVEGSEFSEEEKQDLQTTAATHLQEISKINPDFLCGVIEVDILGHQEYVKATGGGSFQFGTIRDHHPGPGRDIWLTAYSRAVLFHEVGHHISSFKRHKSHWEDFVSFTWEGGPTFQTLRKRSKDQDWQFWFAEKYGDANAAEDFATMFDLSFHSPLAASLLYLQPSSPYAHTPAAHKVEMMYRLAKAPEVEVEDAALNLQRPVAQSLVRAKTVPNGTDLFLFYGNRAKAVDLVTGKENNLSFILELPETNYENFVGLRVGPYFVTFTKKGFMLIPVPGGSNEVIVAKAGQETVSRVRLEELSPKGTRFVGDLVRRGDRVGFFISREGDTLELREFSPASMRSSFVASFQLPRNFLPRHIVPLEGSSDFLLLGLTRHGKELQVLRASRNPTNPARYETSAKGKMGLSNDLALRIRGAVLDDHRLILATKDLDLLYLDLNRDQFVVLNTEITGWGKSFRELHGLFKQDGRIFAIGEREMEQKVIVPLRMDYRRRK